MYKSTKLLYTGLKGDKFGGMTATGRIIRDGKVFDLVAEDDDCKDWEPGRIEALMNQVNDEWDKYGCMVSSLPSELFEKHQRIHKEGMEVARKAGWDGDSELQSDA